jgi:hypothetical protein
MPRTPTSEVAIKIVGRNILAARAEVGITQAKLAARMSANLTVGRLATSRKRLPPDSTSDSQCHRASRFGSQHHRK